MTTERGRGAVPVRAPGRRRRARAGHGRRGVAAQGPRGAPARAARPGEPAARAVPPRRRGLVPRRRGGPAPRDDRGVRCGRAAGSRSTTTAATDSCAARGRPAGARAQGGQLVPRRRARRPAAHVPRLARPGRRRPAEERSVRPEGFDLSAYWTESIAAYEREAPRIEVTVRVRRDASRWLEDVIDTPVLASARRSSSDPEPGVAPLRADARLAARGRRAAAGAGRRGRGPRAPRASGRDRGARRRGGRRLRDQRHRS